MIPAVQFKLLKEVVGFAEHFGSRLGGKKMAVPKGSIVQSRLLPRDSVRVLVWGCDGWAWVDREDLARVAA